ncbi:MAG: hypothetical protein E7436_00890 [Ruminococcaceae bacterium]|nr:hypothetical protein [Oscillospiraceae bacterium]
MIYQLNAARQDALEFYAPVSPARIRKLLRARRSAKKALHLGCLVSGWACIGVSLLVFAYILLG